MFFSWPVPKLLPLDMALTVLALARLVLCRALSVLTVSGQVIDRKVDVSLQ